MDFKEITDLIKLINKTDLTEFKMKDGDFELQIRTKDYGKNKTQTLVTAPQQSIVPIQAPISQSFTPTPAAPVAETPVVSESTTSVPAKESKEEETTNYIEIKSPIVGTFYRASSPDKPPYVKVGDTIEVGDVVCIVEAMKLFNEIESEVRGKLVKVMVEDAQPVEYDQVLYLVDPNG